MKEKKFSPMLAPNESVDLDSINYPVLASYKLDGIRCIFKNGEILSRSLKQIQNKQLREKFEPLRKYSEEHDCILDGEIYSPDLTFQEITGFVMSKDLTDKRSVKKNGCVLEIPESLKFYCFDSITNCGENEQFELRNIVAFESCTNFVEAIHVSHVKLNNKEEVEKYFQKALEDGYEGLILRDPKGRYKYGRGTIKEGLIYKLKPYRTFDAEITGVVQSTIVDPNAEKKTNELGRSVTSKKKDDRILIEKASAFNVDYNKNCDCGEYSRDTGDSIKEYLKDCKNCYGSGIHKKELKVVLAMTDEEKEEVWANRDSYIGKFIEYRGMLVGAKDVPRHPVMIRFRKDKE